MASSISSSSNTSLPPSWLSESNSISFRDASFSSYLNSSEETYIRTLLQSHSRNSRPKKVGDGEIDVFSADKYFNGDLVRERNPKTAGNQHHYKKNNDERVVRSLDKLKLQPRTPSIHSESSWNSQSVLLRRVQRTPSRSTNNGNSQGKRSFLSSCYCCDKKSVDVDRNQELVSNRGNGGFDDLYERGVTRTIKTSLDTAEITRLNKIRQQQSDPFPLPGVSEQLTAVKKQQFDDDDDDDEDEEEEEKRRQKSLEVFGSNEMDGEGSKRFSLDNKLNMLSWDAIPRSVQDVDTTARHSESYRDTESDASSDLFEIECLSCTANPLAVQGVAQPLEDDCATPTTGYAPSEASIDWSVVTASAADFSIVSDLDEQRSVLTSVSRRRMGPKPPSSSAKMAAVTKEVQKPRSAGMLTGCKSQKAVRVAGNSSYRSTGKGKSESQRMHRFSDSFTPATRFHAEAKLPVYGLRQTKTISSSDLLYIQ